MYQRPKTLYYYPRKKTSLGESLAKRHAYNPIRDSRQDTCRTRKAVPRVSPKVSPRVSERVSDWIIRMTLDKTLSETRFFLAGNHIAKSISDKIELMQALFQNICMLRLLVQRLYTINRNAKPICHNIKLMQGLR